MPVLIALTLLPLISCKSRPDIGLLTYPSGPSGVVVSAGNLSISASWSPNPADQLVTSYRVVAAHEAFDEWNPGLAGAVESASIGCCSGALAGVENEHRYYVAVEAMNRLGSARSNLLQVTPPGWQTLQHGSTGSDYPAAIAVGPDGSIAVVGATTGSLDGNANLGGHDAFVCLFDPRGRWAWTQTLATVAEDAATGVAFNPNGEIVVTGYTFGGLPGQSGLGGQDAFAARYSASGSLLWLRQFGTGANDTARGIAIDPAGYFYVVGDTAAGMDGNASAGSLDAFVQKYDSSGLWKWTRQLGTSGPDIGGAVAFANGFIFVGGITPGAIDGNVSRGGNDAFLAEYDPNGTKNWTKQLGSSGDDSVVAVAVDHPGNAYVAGSCPGGFESGQSHGLNDIFLFSYDAAGNMRWATDQGSVDDEVAAGLGVDSSGNLDVVGGLSGGFGTQSQAAMLTYQTPANLSAQDWIQVFASGSGTNPYAGSVDARGNVFSLGITSDGDGVDGNVSSGQLDFFVAKYDKNGVKQ